MVILFILLFIFVITVFFLSRMTNKETAEVKLDNLIWLSKDTAIKETENFPGWTDTSKRSVELTKEAETYCALSIIKDFTVESLKEKDYVGIRWRLDFVHPDRFHVTQESGEDFDSWVSIGKENYQNIGVWIRTEDGHHDHTNEGLLVDKSLKIVSSENPESYGMYNYLDENFLLLEYNPRAFRENHEGLHEINKDIPEGKCELHIWINLDTSYLVKFQLKIQGRSIEGEQIDAEIHHVFTCYNERIEVNPPQWLNEFTKSEGTFTKFETKIPDEGHGQECQASIHQRP